MKLQMIVLNLFMNIHFYRAFRIQSPHFNDSLEGLKKPPRLAIRFVRMLRPTLTASFIAFYKQESCHIFILL